MQHIFTNIRVKIRHFLAVAGGSSLYACLIAPPLRIGIAVMVSVSQTIYLIHKPIIHLTWQKLVKNRFILVNVLLIHNTYSEKEIESAIQRELARIK